MHSASDCLPRSASSLASRSVLLMCWFSSSSSCVLGHRIYPGSIVCAHNPLSWSRPHVLPPRHFSFPRGSGEFGHGQGRGPWQRGKIRRWMSHAETMHLSVRCRGIIAGRARWDGWASQSLGTRGTGSAGRAAEAPADHTISVCVENRWRPTTNQKVPAAMRDWWKGREVRSFAWRY